MNSRVGLLTLISSLAWAQHAAPPASSQINSKIAFTGPSAFQLPKNQGLVNGATEEFSKFLDGQTSPLKADDTYMLNSQGYLAKLQSNDNCDPKLSACTGAIVGRRYFEIGTDELKKVADTYTTDLRLAKDKFFRIGGMEVERHHWEFNGTQATKTLGDMEPMTFDRAYAIKKCRNGLALSWRCNTITYMASSLDDNTIVIIGKQTDTSQEPKTYTLLPCPPSEKKCTAEFKPAQLVNSANGTLALVAFKRDPVAKIVRVLEMNVGAVDDPKEFSRLNTYSEYIQNSLAGEYQVLNKKFLTLNTHALPVTAPVSTSENNKATMAEMLKLEGPYIRTYALMLIALFIFFAIMIVVAPQLQSSGHGPTPVVTSPAPVSQDMIKEQRAFLHHIATPLTVAGGLVSAVKDALGNNPEQAKTVEQLENALKALDRVKEGIDKNRSLLISKSAPPEKSPDKKI